jgi:haloalkane dehalogenase
MEILRTPDERFAALPGWDFPPRYRDVRADDTPAIRMAFVDEGSRDAAPVLLLHGEPSWGYLYRTMIPPLVAAGHRVVVPDLIGFGRSDKPAAVEDYSYARHVAWVWDLVEQLELGEITLFGQDWGGLIGLRLVAEHPERFARVVAGNTGLPTGDQDLGEAFAAWRRFALETPDLPVGHIVNGGSASDLAPEVIAAYDAPFPDPAYKAGARAFPALVPARPDDPAAPAQRAAWESLARFDKPFLTAFSDGDPITRGGDAPFRKMVPGAQGREHPTIAGGGHFLQEDAGPELARVIDELVAGTPGSSADRH